jgi:hypothetical protein
MCCICTQETVAGLASGDMFSFSVDADAFWLMAQFLISRV